MEYVNFLRINKASLLLADKRLNISEIAAAVGFSDSNYFNSKMVTEIAGYIVAPMWRQFMDVALAKLPKEYFQEPPAIPESAPAVLRGAVIWHSLLILTNKDNPQGPPPANPYNDPQTAYWELPIRGWSEVQGTQQEPGDHPESDEEPPQEILWEEMPPGM